jgi:hypothetical protein
MSLTRQSRDQFLEDMLGSYLSHNEYQMVRLLLDSPPLTLHEIAQSVFGGPVDSAELTMCRITLSRLRKRLGAAGWRVTGIEQPGIGRKHFYKLEKAA